MKLQSRSHHSSRGLALPPTGSLRSPADRGSQPTGRGLEFRDREPSFTACAPLLTNHYSPITYFLIGCTAIRKARNSRAIITKCISNRSKIACLRARYLRALRSTNHKSRVTNHESRYNRAVQRAAGESNRKPSSAVGRRHPARHETGFGPRSSNLQH
jgi:hypothetical protein